MALDSKGSSPSYESISSSDDHLSDDCTDLYQLLPVFDQDLILDLEELENTVGSVQSEDQRLCQVCCGVAGKHNYYGGQSCISCRGFFRRSVQTGQYAQFACLNRNPNQICPVDSKTRKSCKKCRFDMCLEAGMRIKWVLNPEERRERVIKRTKNSNNNLPKQVTFHFTTEEKEFVLRLHKEDNDTIWGNYFNILARHPNYFFEIIKTMWDMTSSLSHESVQEAKALNQRCLNDYLVRGGRLIGVLDGHDLDILLRHNSSRHKGLCSSVVEQDTYVIDQYLTSFYNYGVEHRHESPSIDAVVNRMDDLKLAERKLTVDYDPIYTSTGIMKRHRELSKFFMAWAKDDEEFDLIKNVLLNFIILLNTDGLEIGRLKNRKAIEDLQHKLVTLLYRYVKDKYPRNANTVMASGIMIIQLAQEAYELISPRLPL